MAAFFENRTYAITRPHIVQPDYIYNMASRRCLLPADATKRQPAGIVFTQ